MNIKDKLQATESKAGFGKTQTCFYWINQTDLSPTEKHIINYILNFNQNDKPFTGKYSTIAKAGGYSESGIKSVISRMVKTNGLIKRGKQISIKDQDGNYHGSNIEGGLWVDIDLLIKLHKIYIGEIVIEDNTPIIPEPQPEIQKPRENNKEKQFGEPETIEYLYGGKWWTMEQHITEEIITLRNYNKSLTIDIIKDACEGKNVDTGLFQFRLTKQQEHETNI